MHTPRSAAALLFLATAAAAQSTVWTGSRSASWIDPGNWTSGVPTSRTATTIRSGSFQPVLSGNHDCGDLTVLAPIDIRANTRLEAHGSADVRVAGLGAGTLAVHADFAATSAFQPTEGTVEFLTRAAHTVTTASNAWASLHLVAGTLSLAGAEHRFTGSLIADAGANLTVGDLNMEPATSQVFLRSVNPVSANLRASSTSPATISISGFGFGTIDSTLCTLEVLDTLTVNHLVCSAAQIIGGPNAVFEVFLWEIYWTSSFGPSVPGTVRIANLNLAETSSFGAQSGTVVFTGGVVNSSGTPGGVQNCVIESSTDTGTTFVFNQRTSGGNSHGAISFANLEVRSGAGLVVSADSQNPFAPPPRGSLAVQNLTVRSGASFNDHLGTDIGTLTVEGAADVVMAGANQGASIGRLVVPSAGSIALSASSRYQGEPLGVVDDLLVDGTMTWPAGARILHTGEGSIRGNLPAFAATGVGCEVESATVDGDFTQSSGYLDVEQLAVTGAFSFSGSDLTGPSQSELVVTGAASVTPTSTVTDPPDVIKCRGDWTSDGNFAPTSGTVRFLGTAPQTATAPTLNGVWVLAGSSVTMGGTTIQGLLRVDGNLHVNGSLDLGGNVAVDGSILGAAPFDLHFSGSAALTSATGSGQVGVGSAVKMTSAGNQVTVQDVTFGDLTLERFAMQVSGTVRSGPIRFPNQFPGPGAYISGGPGDALLAESITFEDQAFSAVGGGLGRVELGPLDVGVTNSFGAQSGIVVFKGSATVASAGNLNADHVQIGSVEDGAAFVDFWPFGQQTPSNFTIDRLEIVNGGAEFGTEFGIFMPQSSSRIEHLDIVDGRVHWQSRGAFIRNVTIAAGSDLRVTGEWPWPFTERVEVLGSLTLGADFPNPSANGQFHCQDLLVAPSGHVQFSFGSILPIPFGQLTVTGNCLVDGTMLLNPPSPPRGTSADLFSYLRLRGAGTVRGSLVNTELSAGGTAYTLDGVQVAGDLAMRPEAAVARIGRVAISRDAKFEGDQVVALDGTAVLDVGGDLVLRTGSPLTTPPSRIECSGSWTSDTSFAPTLGVVAFDGSGVQAVTLGAPLLHSLEIGPSSQVDLASLTLSGSLLVDGTLTLPPTATVLLTGNGWVRAPGGPLPNLTVSAGTYDLQTATITGNLEQQAACVSLGLGDVDVAGDATLRGGTVTASALSPVDDLVVGGDLRIETHNSTTAPPDRIEVLGNWTANALFLPASGLVVLGGTSTTVDHTASGGVCQFWDLVFASGTTTPLDRMESKGPTCQVAPGATLDMGTRRLILAPGATTTVEGEVRLDQAGSLLSQFQGEIRFLPGSTLYARGRPTNKAKLIGIVSGFELGGHIDAWNLTIDGLDERGVRILESATFAAAPYDMRGTTIATGSSLPGSRLVDIARASGQPLELWDWELMDNGPSQYGVASSGLGRIDLINFTGGLAGEQRELDPNGVLFWSERRTELAAGFAAGGFLANRVRFATAREIAAQRYRFSRSPDASGPWTVLRTVLAQGSASAGASYAHDDNAVLAGEEWHYLVEEQLLHDAWRPLFQDRARVFSAQVGDTAFVGRGGFASIAAAIAAVPPGGSVVVGAGTHAPFLVDKPVHLLAAGDGEVVIAGVTPTVISSLLPTAAEVAIQGFTFGDGTTPGGAELLRIEDAANIVLLDDVTFVATPPQDALRILRSPRVKLQAVGADAKVALDTATTYVANSSFPALDLVNASSAIHAATTPGTVTFDATSTVTPLAGAAVRVECDAVWQAGNTVDLEVRGAGNDLFGLFLGQSLAFQDLSLFVPLDMVLMLPAPITIAQGLLPPSGEATVALPVSREPSLRGFHLALQVYSLDFTTLTGRFGAARHFVFVP